MSRAAHRSALDRIGAAHRRVVEPVSVVDQIAGSKWKTGRQVRPRGSSASDDAGRASAGITEAYIGPRCRQHARSLTLHGYPHASRLAAAPLTITR
jgi:hypothetical protein